MYYTWVGNIEGEVVVILWYDVARQMSLVSFRRSRVDEAICKVLRG